MLVQVQYILSPLIHTKKSESVAALFNRYLQTALYFRNWTRMDLISPEGEGRKSILAVRRMHTNAFEKMNQKYPQNSGKVWVSQYDMLITQFAIIGLILVVPEKYGIKTEKRKTKYLGAGMHFWRVVGYALGMKDEYNLFSGTYDENMQLAHLICREAFLPLFKGQASPTGSKMSEEIVTSLQDIFPTKPTFTPVYLSLLEYFSDEDELKPQLTNFGDKMYYKTMNAIFSSGSSYLISFMGKLSNRAMDRAEKRKKKISKNLDKNYPQISFHMDEYIQVEFNGKLQLNHEPELRSKCPFAVSTEI